MEQPKVYLTFTAKDRDSNDLVKFVIKDLTETHFPDAVTFIRDHFIPDEMEAKSRRVLNDKRTRVGKIIDL